MEISSRQHTEPTTVFSAFDGCKTLHKPQQSEGCHMRLQQHSCQINSSLGKSWRAGSLVGWTPLTWLALL